MDVAVELETTTGGDEEKMVMPSVILEYVKDHGDLVFDDGESVYKISLITNENGYSPDTGTTIDPEGVLGQASGRLGCG